METAPTESFNTYDGQRNVIHSLVFGGEAPSKETETRATFLKTFLAEYYTTALQGSDYTTATNTESNAHGTTTACNISNTTCDDKAGSTRARTTEHPSLFNSLNNIDEAERLNKMRDMASKLAEKLGGVYKGLTGSKGVAHNVAATKLVDNVLKPIESPKEVGDLSQHLELFVDNINESLHLLGTTDLTEEELKLLLAAAPLPSIGHSGTPSTSSPHISQRPRSRSAGEILARTASPKSLVSRRLKHSISEGVRHVTKDPSPSKLSLVTSTIEEQDEENCDPQSEQPEDAEVMITRPRSCSVDSDGVARELLSSAEATPTGTPGPGRSKRRLSSFFTKKMESFTNLLDNIEFAENDSPRTFSKSKSFNLGMNNSGPSTPKSGGATPTPRSGNSTPQGGEGEFLDMTALKLKLELVERALCAEVVLRTAAEQKATQCSDLVARIKTDLDRAQSQKETVAVINKQMGVELRFLRARNTKSTRDRQQWEDALISETKRRRTLEEQMQMLIKSYQERNVNNGPPEDGELTNKQQEEVFSSQREEVLLAVIESLRAQFHTADSEMEQAKTEWQEERARYQETHDLLRFQLDQLTLTRQSTTGKDSELNEEVDEMLKERDAPKSRQLRHQVSVHDLRESTDSVEAKKEQEKPVTERMKVFFLSSSWWPKFDFINNNTSVAQPPRPPVLLMQIAWWISELREYAQTQHQDNMRLLAGSHNQFCACDECVSKATTNGL